MVSFNSFRMSCPRSITVRVPANIALIKYWGKRDEDLILPLNDSVSLSVDSLFATTCLTIREGGGAKDTVAINGKEVDLAKSKRFGRVFDDARRLMRKDRGKKDGETAVCHSFEVSSSTSFPVAAGLASSAAGFAAIAVCLGRLCGFEEKEISRIARIGSGSATRSVFDGLVHWKAGEDSAGLDCYAERVFPHSHWPELRAVILVLDGSEKETGSTVGMRRSQQTSSLIQYRASHIVPKRVQELIAAFRDKDFASFARITMADSNQFHAVCLDTYPPLRYMSDVSFSITRLVHSFNDDVIRAAYSFDAGPNACVFLLQDHLPSFLSLVSQRFSLSPAAVSSIESSKLLADFQLSPSCQDPAPLISDVIVSTVGCGPQVIDS